MMAPLPAGLLIAAAIAVVVAVAIFTWLATDHWSTERWRARAEAAEQQLARLRAQQRQRRQPTEVLLSGGGPQ